MELQKVLYMKGGSGSSTYGHSGYVTKKVISMTKGRREEAMRELITNHELTIQNGKPYICIADLGCASGPNTWTVISDLIVTSEKIRLESGHLGRIEYQIYLNDLHGNDFNSIFLSIPKYHQDIKEQTGLEDGQLFVAAMLGSFYGRLFPTQSLHFVHSSYSLHWLSQVPDELKDNNNDVYISNTSPKSVVKAYKDQFQKDTQMFLTSRSIEMVKGGKMVLTYMGRSTEDPVNDETCILWDALAQVLKELVFQGILEEEKLKTFNIPMYHASSTELIEEVEKEGSFYINTIDITQIHFIDDEENDIENPGELEYKVSKLLWAVFESIFASHFGETVADKALSKLASLIATKYNVLLTIVTISLTKK